MSLTFRGTAASKNAGDLTFKTFDSVNGAESALGFDIDGQTGASGISGPVTVVYGNTNGGAADFAIILLNTASVDASDFNFGTPAAVSGAIVVADARVSTVAEAEVVSPTNFSPPLVSHGDYML
jgi:serralysin